MIYDGKNLRRSRRTRFLASTSIHHKSSIINHKSSASRGSIIVIILVTLVFTALALTVFMDKAGNDLIAESREANDRRLRQEAYSALHTTLAVLNQFASATRGLHSPAEGWNDPLGFAAYEPADGRTVEVLFEDESGKIPLPRATAIQLQNLFVAWEMPTGDAERLADALLGWMKKDHIYATSIFPDYDQVTLPYVVPQRSLRTFGELAAIEYARTVFFDENGRPTELYRKFTEAVSLFDFQQINLNGARPDALTAVGEFADDQKKRLEEYLTGTGSALATGPGWFTNVSEALPYLGPAGNTRAFGTTITALRIRLTVHEGRTEFRLNVVVAPPGSSANPVMTTATSTRANREDQAVATPGGSGQGNRSQPTNSPTAAAAAAAANKKLNYPFRVLEIRENDAPPLPPPPPPAP